MTYIVYSHRDVDPEEAQRLDKSYGPSVTAIGSADSVSAAEDLVWRTVKTYGHRDDMHYCIVKAEGIEVDINAAVAS